MAAGPTRRLLRVGARADLAGLLLESLEGEADSDLEAAWAAEIERRVAQIDAGTVKAMPWEEIRRRLVARLTDH
jgi:putative addiction module component (TIGR02574 family)